MQHRRYPRGHFPELPCIPGREEVRDQGRQDKESARIARREAQRTRPQTRQDQKDIRQARQEQESAPLWPNSPLQEDEKSGLPTRHFRQCAMHLAPSDFSETTTPR